MSHGNGEGEAAFKEAYASLNAAQKEAVDTIDGPVMVIAGPGTGKTQILTLRIANILLQTDTQPEQILALTFTESGAQAMRMRLRRYLGAAAYRVPIYTFHGLANHLIHTHPDAFPRVIGGRPVTELERVRMVEDILEGGQFKLLRPMGNPTYYVKKILQMVQTMKRENVTPAGFVQIIAEQEETLAGIERVHEKGAHKGKVRGEYAKQEKSVNKNRELLAVYQQYEALLRQQNLYDFDDMIIEAIATLESNEDVRLDVQETYQYVHADEHQDVNGSQNRILELLASGQARPNLFVVGDEKQAIYRFQGASLENFLYFEESFGATKTIQLTENYRSGQVILDAAHSLVETDDERLAPLRIPLNAAAISDAAVELRQFSHQAVEDDWVAAEIKVKIEAGTAAEEIAVIVRTNREVEHFTRRLRSAGVAATATADSDILTHPITVSARALLTATAHREQEPALFTLLHAPFWRIQPADLVRLCAARSGQRTLASLIANEHDVLSELKISAPDRITRVNDVLTEANNRSVVEAPHRVMEYLFTASGFVDHVLATDTIEGTRVLRRLYDEVEEMVQSGAAKTLRDVVDTFTRLEAYNLPLTAPYIASNTHAVQVMTAHRAKGLEFDVVVAPRLVDSTWGGSSHASHFDIPIAKRLDTSELDALDDERRLLYVLITRARQQLLLSNAAISAEGKSFSPSRLLSEIDESLLTLCDTTEAEATFAPTAVFSPVAQQPLIDPALCHELFAQRGFSATSLNNYLSSPWDYFYRNLLRIPELQSLHLLYGTAVHAVLEQVCREHAKHAVLASASEVTQYLDAALNRLPLSVAEYTKLHERAFAALGVYVPHMGQSLPKETQVEASIRVVLETGIPELPQIPLSGKLDRIDFDKNGQAVRVVDYKTGTPRSRNAIEGNTKNDDGGYKRQLIFYALLLELYDDERLRCRNMTLSFVEPTAKGEIKEEMFTISTEEIEDLKQVIIASAKEIVSGEFLTQPCDETTCSYCGLVSALQAERGG